MTLPAFLKACRDLFRHSIIVLQNVIHLCLPYHSAAWRATREPVEMFLNEVDPNKQDEMTARWRDAMQQQVMITAITSALIASLVATVLSWPPHIFVSGGINPIERSSNIALAMWLISLLFALTSIGTATNQAIAILRLSVYNDGLSRIRASLNKRGTFPHAKVDRWQMVLWQVPAAFLNGSLYLFIAGLGLLIWDTKILDQGNFKISATIVVAFATCIGSYTMATVGLYYRIGKLS